MSPLFQFLGVVLAGYVVYAMTTGAVYAKSGPWGRTFRRDEEPFRYWSAIVVYVLLSLALLFVF